MFEVTFKGDYAFAISNHAHGPSAEPYRGQLTGGFYTYIRVDGKWWLVRAGRGIHNAWRDLTRGGTLDLVCPETWTPAIYDGTTLVMEEGDGS